MHGQTTSSAPSQKPPLPPWLFNYCSDNTILLVFTFRCNIHSLKNSFHKNRSKSYVNRMNVKLHLRKHNLKRQMCSAPYWLSPATLCEILRHGCDSLTDTITQSVLHVRVKHQGQAEMGAELRAAAQTSWPGAVEQLESGEAIESRQEPVGPWAGRKNRQGCPSSKIPFSPISHFRRGC